MKTSVKDLAIGMPLLILGAVWAYYAHDGGHFFLAVSGLVLAFVLDMFKLLFGAASEKRRRQKTEAER
ncbi:hypothetical protein [Roseibium sp. SCP14]|uniref:hypothetical protein n=1 Tax=Roseibium sp. SCP14 TaxID=3141375 RepID=UPI00333D08EC